MSHILLNSAQVWCHISLCKCCKDGMKLTGFLPVQARTSGAHYRRTTSAAKRPPLPPPAACISSSHSSSEGVDTRRWFMFSLKLCIAASGVKMILFAHCSDVAVLCLCQSSFGGLPINVFCERFPHLPCYKRLNCCCEPSKQGYALQVCV